MSLKSARSKARRKTERLLYEPISYPRYRQHNKDIASKACQHSEPIVDPGMEVNA